MTEQGGTTCRTTRAPAAGGRPGNGLQGATHPGSGTGLRAVTRPGERTRSQGATRPGDVTRPRGGGTLAMAPVRTASAGVVRQAPAAPRARGLTGQPALLLLASLIVALLAALALPGLLRGRAAFPAAARGDKLDRAV